MNQFFLKKLKILEFCEIVNEIQAKERRKEKIENKVHLLITIYFQDVI